MSFWSFRFGMEGFLLLALALWRVRELARRLELGLDADTAAAESKSTKVLEVKFVMVVG